MHVIDAARDKLKVNVSDRLREALERLDQAIDRLDTSADAVPAVATDGARLADSAAIAAKLDRMIQRVEAALAD